MLKPKAATDILSKACVWFEFWNQQDRELPDPCRIWMSSNLVIQKSAMLRIRESFLQSTFCWCDQFC